MVKTWIEPEEEIKRKGSIMEAGLAGIEALERAVPSRFENLPLSELRKQPPAKFVKTKQRWCDRFIAESYSNANINKEKNKISFNIVLNVITEKCNGKPFDIGDILNLISATNLSDGTLQRKILSWMVCLGILKMNHVKIKDKNGKTKIKYIFVKNTEIMPCPKLVSGKCSFDWKNASITDYFPPEYKKQLDEEISDSEEDE